MIAESVYSEVSTPNTNLTERKKYTYTPKHTIHAIAHTTHTPNTLFLQTYHLELLVLNSM